MAVRWTTDGIHPLGTLPGGTNSIAMAVSFDGSVIVGTSDDGTGKYQAVRWTTQSGVQSLGIVGDAYAVTPDGGKITGLTGPNVCFRWTAQDGIDSPHHLAGFGSFQPLCISPDGAFVGGGGSFGPGFSRGALIWGTNGAVSVVDSFITNAGIDLSGWVFQSVIAAAGEGGIYTLLCDGRHNGVDAAFIVSGLPMSFPALPRLTADIGPRNISLRWSPNLPNLDLEMASKLSDPQWIGGPVKTNLVILSTSSKFGFYRLVWQ
jgi:hypothetical protein